MNGVWLNLDADWRTLETNDKITHPCLDAIMRHERLTSIPHIMAIMSPLQLRTPERKLWRPPITLLLSPRTMAVSKKYGLFGSDATGFLVSRQSLWAEPVHSPDEHACQFRQCDRAGRPIDGDRPATVQQALDDIRSLKVGSVIQLTIDRNGKIARFRVALA